MTNELNSEYDYRSTEYKVALLSAYEEAQMKSFSEDDACAIIQSKVYDRETAENAKNIFTTEWFSRQLIPMQRKSDMAQYLISLFAKYNIFDEEQFYQKIESMDPTIVEQIKYFRAVEFGIPYYSTEYDLLMLYIYEQKEMECIYCWRNDLEKAVINYKEAYRMTCTYTIEWFSRLLKPLELKIKIAPLFLEKADKFGIVENRDLFELIAAEDEYILNRIKYHIPRES